MSRYGDSYDYDEPFQNAGALFWANADRALKGKRGRKVLADLRDALRALPQPRLIEGALCTVNLDKRVEGGPDDWHAQDMRRKVGEDGGEGVCAVGAYLWWQRVKAGVDPQEAFDELPTLDDDNYELHDTAMAAKRAGVVYSLAWDLAYRNDETYGRKTPEERHAAFLQWLDEQLAEAAS